MDDTDIRVCRERLEIQKKTAEEGRRGAGEAILERRRAEEEAERRRKNEEMLKRWGRQNKKWS